MEPGDGTRSGWMQALLAGVGLARRTGGRSWTQEPPAVPPSRPNSPATDRAPEIPAPPLDLLPDPRDWSDAPALDAVWQCLTDSYDEAIVGRFQLVPEPGVTSWPFARVIADPHFLYRFLDHPAVRAHVAANRPSTTDESERYLASRPFRTIEGWLGFYTQSTFEAVAALSDLLSCGDPKRREATPDARVLAVMRGFTDESFGDRYSATRAYRTDRRWSRAFSGALQATFVFVDMETGLATVVLISAAMRAGCRPAVAPGGIADAPETFGVTRDARSCPALDAVLASVARSYSAPHPLGARFTIEPDRGASLASVARSPTFFRRFIGSAAVAAAVSRFGRPDDAKPIATPPTSAFVALGGLADLLSHGSFFYETRVEPDEDVLAMVAALARESFAERYAQTLGFVTGARWLDGRSGLFEYTLLLLDTATGDATLLLFSDVD